MGETSGKGSDIAELHKKLGQSCNAAMKSSRWYILWDVKEVTHHIKLAQDKIHIETRQIQILHKKKKTLHYYKNWCKSYFSMQNITINSF